MPESKGFRIFLVVFSAFVSVVLGVAGTKLADTFLFKDQLVYEVTNGEPFVSNNETIQITRLVVENEGKKLMEDVDVLIDPKGRKIDQYQVYGPVKDQVKIIQESELFHAHIPYLNPGEELIIQFLFRAGPGIDANLFASVRSKGIVGELKSDKEPRNISFLTVAPAVLSTVAFALAGFLLRIVGDINAQRDVMYALYAKYKFKEFAGRMLDSPRAEVTYVLESEALTTFALTAVEEGAISRAIAVQQDLLRQRQIHPTSMQVAKLNIAKLFLASGNEREAKLVLKGVRLRRSNILIRLKIEEPELKGLLEKI
jgi:hypothetical protein